MKPPFAVSSNPRTRSSSLALNHVLVVSFFVELKSELDMAATARGANYCGSCYGGVEPETGCCNSCEDVRQSYINRGWSFTAPESIDQVGSAFFASEDWPLTVSQ